METLIRFRLTSYLVNVRCFTCCRDDYDLPEFVPRHWDLDEHGNKKPNKCALGRSKSRIASTNLMWAHFNAKRAMLAFRWLGWNSMFGGSRIRRTVGRILMRMPVVGEYLCVRHH